LALFCDCFWLDVVKRYPLWYRNQSFAKKVSVGCHVGETFIGKVLNRKIFSFLLLLWITLKKIWTNQLIELIVKPLLSQFLLLNIGKTSLIKSTRFFNFKSLLSKFYLSFSVLWLNRNYKSHYWKNCSQNSIK